MLSTGSLAAFTSAFTGAPVARVQPVREARDIGPSGQQGAASGLNASPLAPNQGRQGQTAPPPAGMLPRGSLINLSV